MTEYFTAQNARENTREAKTLLGSYKKSETEEVLKHILSASQKGLNAIEIGICDPIVDLRLKELGFATKITRDQRDGDYMTITW